MKYAPECPVGLFFWHVDMFVKWTKRPVTPANWCVASPKPSPVGRVYKRALLNCPALERGTSNNVAEGVREKSLSQARPKQRGANANKQGPGI